MSDNEMPKKVEYEEYVKSTGMFFVNEEFEAGIKREVQLSVDTLCQKMKGIFTDGGLEEYIKTDDDSLDNLISVMNISSEKFKRVITMLRLEKGHQITGEWDLGKIRTMMISRPQFMTEVCDLLRTGSKNEKYQSLIPPFYLENFCIDSQRLYGCPNRQIWRRC